MSSVIQAIFGGGHSESKSSSTPTNLTNPALQALANPLSNALQSLLSSYGGTISGAGNPIDASKPTNTAPLSGQETNLLNTIGSQVGPGTASAGYIRNVLNGDYMPGSPSGNPFLAAAITAAQRPTLDNLTETLTRALPGRFAQAGQQLQPNSPGSTGGGSSAFDRAAALAFQSAANTSTDIASNIGNNAYNTGVQQQENAASLDQNQVNNTISALQASALPRLIQQNGLDQGLAEFNSQIQSLLQLLTSIGAVQAPTVAQTTQSTSSGDTYKGVVPDLFPKGI